ncbi:glycosyltransferase family 2 protein [Geovibrio sp. ADMFC3]
MKISIITAVWNNRETIRDAIESVLSQTYKNIEYVVVDGGSTDGTVDVIKSYGDKVTKFVSEKDKGIYDALNKGVNMATGDVIGFLHSDDVFADENSVAKIAEAFRKNTDGVYSDLVYTLKKDTSKVLRFWKSCDFTPKLLSHGWMPAHPTLYFRREVYERFGMFDLNFRIAADYDFILRVFTSGINTVYIPEVLYKMRLGGASNKSLKNIIRKSREDYIALRNNGVGGLGTLFIKNISKLGQFFKYNK